MITMQHENITNTRGFIQKEYEMWLLMDYANLGSIENLCSTFGPLEEQTVGVYLRQILAGLAYLHEHKVVHRDIKPSNLLLTDEGIVKLSDFGSFHRMETSQTVDDMVSTLKGSIMYMAPEAAQQSSPSRKSDIWSLGCVVLEMTTGEKPWSELQFDNLYAALMVIATSGKSPTVPEKLSEHLKDFLSKCFKLDPKERLTAKELLQHPFLKKYPSEKTISQTSLPN
jgi:serine/threonine protein kinase